jgi:hypothetical protein
MTTAFATSSDARKHFSEVLDGAATGVPVTVQRGKERFAVSDADRLRLFFAQSTTPGLRIGRDGNVWVASMDHRPFVAEGLTRDGAIDALIEELREYAEEWAEHYEGAPNHQSSWGLVQLVSLSSDHELAMWLRSEAV